MAVVILGAGFALGNAAMRSLPLWLGVLLTLAGCPQNGNRAVTSDMHTPEHDMSRGEDAIAYDASMEDLLRRDLSMTDASTNVNTLCRPMTARCEPLVGNGNPCCDGTICELYYDVAYCVHDRGGTCASDLDCLGGWVCGTDGLCGYPPMCALNNEACGSDRPEITLGCCDSLSSCESDVYPSRCCRSSGSNCSTDDDCCIGDSCSENHVCLPPSCAATGDTLRCSLFPGISCCDSRLSCMPVDPHVPATRHCCAPTGTVITSNDGAICCSGGVFTSPDGTQSCHVAE